MTSTIFNGPIYSMMRPIEYNLHLVENVTQAGPIKNMWGISEQKVYEGE